MRHFRGDIGDVLNTRAVQMESSATACQLVYSRALLTFLEHACAVDFEDAGVIFILLIETHGRSLIDCYRSSMNIGNRGSVREL